MVLCKFFVVLGDDIAFIVSPDVEALGLVNEAFKTIDIPHTEPSAIYYQGEKDTSLIVFVIPDQYKNFLPGQDQPSDRVKW